MIHDDEYPDEDPYPDAIEGPPDAPDDDQPEADYDPLEDDTFGAADDAAAQIMAVCVEAIEAETMEVDVAMIVSETSPDGIADLWYHIDRAIGILSEWKRALVTATGARFGEGDIQLASGEILKVDVSKTYRWDDARVRSAVLNAAFANRRIDEYGEIEGDVEVVARVIEEAAHVDYWRTKALTRLGINWRPMRDETERFTLKIEGPQ